MESSSEIGSQDELETRLQLNDDIDAASYLQRPNRQHGPDSTHITFIEDEIKLTNQLLKERDRDLAIHLYNAHALKKRNYDEKKAHSLKSWAPKEHWSTLHGLQNSDESTTIYDRVWTAWPLDPKDVPRLEGEVAPESGSDKEQVFKRPGKITETSQLENILTAITLKMARELFNQRDWLTKNNMTESSDSSEEQTIPYKSPILTDLDVSNAADAPEATTGRQDQDAYSPDNDNVESVGAVDMYQDKNTSASPRLYTGFSIDDEQSERILLPSVRHTLSRLDDILVSLHHSRDVHYASSTCSDHSQASELESEEPDENTAASPSDLGDEAHKTPAKRGRGRPRKETSILTASQDVVMADDSQPKRDSRGRKKTIQTPMEGETYHEMMFRIARKQKKRLPAGSSLSPSRSSRSPSITAESPRRRSQSKRSASKRRRKVSRRMNDDPENMLSSSEEDDHRRRTIGIRDWSEVIGAAIPILPPDVIARAAQRCSDLFGEDMDLLTIDDIESGEGSEDLEPGTRSTNSCPDPSCEDASFENREALVDHLREIHEMTMDGANALIGDVFEDEEEIQDGVHVDGFLKPLKLLNTDKPKKRKLG